jgi:hypothetical protein
MIHNKSDKARAIRLPLVLASPAVYTLTSSKKIDHEALAEWLDHPPADSDKGKGRVVMSIGSSRRDDKPLEMLRTVGAIETINSKR